MKKSSGHENIRARLCLAWNAIPASCSRKVSFDPADESSACALHLSTAKALGLLYRV